MMRKTNIFGLIFVMALLILLTGNVSVQAATKKSKVTTKLSNGTLTVSGTGKMQKTFQGDERIQKVIIRKGVTSICSNAFKDCVNLTSVRIANTVKFIGGESFYNTGLEQVTFPKSVKTIGWYCLGKCANLKKVTLPGDFKDKDLGCPDHEACFVSYPLETVQFTTQLNTKVVGALDTKNFQVSAADKKYKTVNGVIYTKDGREVVRYPSERKDIILEEGCEIFNTDAICYHFYDDEDMEGSGSINMPSKLVIPKSVKEIKGNYSGILTGGIALEIKAENLSGESVSALLDIEMYRKNRKDWADKIAEAMPGKITVDQGMYIYNQNTLLLYDRNRDEDITIPEGIEIIGNQVFYRGDEYEEAKCVNITLPSTLKVIGKRAFGYMYFTKLELPQGIKALRKESLQGINLQSKQLDLPDSITTIEPYALQWTELETIKLPKNIRKIAEGCCDSNWKLKKIEGAEKVRIIGKEAFHGCSELDIADFLAKRKITKIGDNAFENCKWNRLVLPKTIKKVGKDALLRDFKKQSKPTVTIHGKGWTNKARCFGVFRNLKVTFRKGIGYAWTELYFTCTNTKKGDVKIIDAQWNGITNASGYELQLSHTKTFKKILKTVNCKKAETSKSLKVKSNQFIYGRIRPYAIKNGKKVCGKWTVDRE